MCAVKRRIRIPLHDIVPALAEGRVQQLYYTCDNTNRVVPTRVLHGFEHTLC